MKHFCVSLVFFFSPFFRGQVQRNYNYHSEIQTISLVAHNSHDYSVICSFYALAPTWWLQTDQLWFLKRYPSTPVSKTAFRSRQTDIVVDGCAKRCDAIFKLGSFQNMKISNVGFRICKGIVRHVLTAVWFPFQKMIHFLKWFQHATTTAYKKAWRVSSGSCTAVQFTTWDLGHLIFELNKRFEVRHGTLSLWHKYILI